MGTYFDLVPGDINRMIEEYASREILVVHKDVSIISTDIVSFDIVFPGPVTFTIPFIVDKDELQDFVKPSRYVDYEYILGSNRTRNTIKRTRGTATIYGYDEETPIAQLNPRLSSILLTKLKRLLQDV